VLVYGKRKLDGLFVAKLKLGYEMNILHGDCPTFLAFSLVMFI
jgi:hypothetical protein